MSHTTKKIRPLALLEEGAHVPVVPRGETAVCHTQRILWPKDAGGHIPMLAVHLSKGKDVAIVLMPRACGAPKSRRSNVFSARELMLYTGETLVPPATEEELREIPDMRAKARERKKATRAEIEHRRARTPARAARAAITSAT